MKKRRSDNIKTLLLTVLLVLASRASDSLPWWFFAIPVLVLGIVTGLQKWDLSAFLVGFVAGFLIWFGANLYFDLTVNGIIVNRLGLLLYVPDFVILLVSGIIGGLLTALALYTGKSIVVEKRAELTF
jgi:hypothetical protein